MKSYLLVGAHGRRPLWSPRVKIQAPKLRSQVLKTMSWKSYPKISQAPKLRSQVLKIMSWKPYPKISQVYLPGRPALPVRQTDIVDEEKLSEKWLLITSLSGCSLEQKLPSSVTDSPDRTRPVTPFFTSAIPGLRSALECPNLNFAHRLRTGNSALRLAPGPLCDGPELRHGRTHGRSEFIYKIGMLFNIKSWIIPAFVSSSFLKKPLILILTFQFSFWQVLWVQVWARFLQFLNPVVLVLTRFFNFNNLLVWFKI
jgi:hypothetical protein